jgi:DNA-binding transcriptional LysR family regulator
VDVTRLRTLRELMVRESMAEVAEALCVTPSAISQHLAHLEQEAGVRLIERHGRRVKLTHEGERLAWHAERVIGVLDEAMAEMQVLQGQVVGVLRVAAFSSAALALMPQTMSAMQKIYPGVRIVLQELEGADGLAALRAWTVDLAIVDDLTTLPSAASANIALTPLMTDTLYAVVGKEHRLAGRSAIQLHELKDDSWAMDLASHPYSRVVIDACRAAGFEPAVNAYSSNLDLLLGLIGQGCSVSILPGLCVAKHRLQMAVLKLNPNIERTLHVACRRTAKERPAVKALTAQLLEAAKQLKRPPARGARAVPG